MDLLSQVLETIKLRGTVYFHARFQSPWGMQVPEGQFANFHIVTEGECWLQIKKNDDATLLQKGDIVLFPRGNSHSLVDSLQSDIIPASKLLKFARKSASNEIVFGGHGSNSNALICGHFEYDKQCQHPLFQTLPSVIHISSLNNSNANWFLIASELATMISKGEGLGKEAAVNRMAESLFIQVLADYLASLDDHSSFLAAIADKNISLALNSMHEKIDHDWSLAELAEIACMSKSVFSTKFHDMVGEPPIIYLARWRMLKAREMLSETSMSINLISTKVGYQSEFSFSKAFKKITGSSPGAFRKSKAV